MSKITIGILTCNRKEAVLKAIESAYWQEGIEGHEIEIIVVDAASTDGTTDAIRNKYPNVKLMRLPKNLGCPAGRNYVYVNSTGDYIVNVDDDGFLEKDAVKYIIDTFEQNETVGVVAIKQCFIGADNQGIAISDKNEDVGMFRGGVSAFRGSALLDVGLYPDDFFMYSEEWYLSLKFLDAGYRIVSQPKSIMWHPKIGSSGRNKKLDYERFKNKMLVVTRLFPGKYLFIHLCKRLISGLYWAVRKGTIIQYFKAVIYVIYTLPRTLRERKACSKQTIERYLELSKNMNVMK